MLVRTRYQYDGSLRLRKRERGPDVWEFRYYETDSKGRRKRQSVILADRALYVTETQARKATQALLLRLNGESPRAEVEAASFGALLDRYIEYKSCRNAIQPGSRICRTSGYTSAHDGVSTHGQNEADGDGTVVARFAGGAKVKDSSAGNHAPGLQVCRAVGNCRTRHEPGLASARGMQASV